MESETSHPQAIYFLFSSHKLYSRLDHFLISAPLLPSIVASEIDPITWSDHAPITIDLLLHSARPKTCHWWLNESFLRIPDIRESLQVKLSEYFQLNEGSVSDASILWKAHKAFFRGECISAGSRRKRESNQQRSDLLTQLRAAEMHLLRSPTVARLRAVVSIRNRLKSLDLSRISKAMMWSRQRFYEFADKPHAG